MRSFDKEYIPIKGVSTPGNYTQAYLQGSQHPYLSTGLLPVYKVVKMIENALYNLEAGFQDKDGDFYSCPIPVGYIEISSVEVKAVPLDRYFRVTTKATVRVYSKDLKKRRIECVEICTNEDLSNSYLRHLELFINVANNFIENDNDINDLSLDKAISVDQFLFYDKKIPFSVIMSAVNKLEIRLFNCCAGRAGKDNSFWSRADISNLPEDTYLKYLFAKSLSDEYGHIHDKENAYSITYGHSSSFSSYVPEEEYESFSESTYIKDVLKVFACMNYSKAQHLSYMVKS